MTSTIPVKSNQNALILKKKIEATILLTYTLCIVHSEFVTIYTITLKRSICVATVSVSLSTNYCSLQSCLSTFINIYKSNMNAISP